jgi:hypothetical protein
MFKVLRQQGAGPSRHVAMAGLKAAENDGDMYNAQYVLHQHGLLVT